MSLNPVITHRLVQIAQAAATTASGGTLAFSDAACAERGFSLATRHR